MEAKRITDDKLAHDLVSLKARAASAGMWGVFRALNKACESSDWINYEPDTIEHRSLRDKERKQKKGAKP